MYSSLNELKQQNQEISHLCDVLCILVKQPSLNDNPFVKQLMTQFKEKVWIHLVFEDNNFYSSLINSDDEKVRETAQAFHDSAKEIKHRFSDFIRNCCSHAESDSEYQAFSEKSHEVFTLIRNRIAYENEHIFPLVEKML
ncbi:MAG: hemerythrin domain-containing protein [Gammaproteobacteria bacterium]|nr:hemerythrin domain-containing protein [Gammaproteobacteria bacterium]